MAPDYEFQHKLKKLAEGDGLEQLMIMRSMCPPTSTQKINVIEFWIQYAKDVIRQTIDRS